MFKKLFRRRAVNAPDDNIDDGIPLDADDEFTEAGDGDVVDANAQADMLNALADLEREFDEYKTKADAKAQEAIVSAAAFQDAQPVAVVTFDIEPVTNRIRAAR